MAAKATAAHKPSSAAQVNIITASKATCGAGQKLIEAAMAAAVRPEDRVSRNYLTSSLFSPLHNTNVILGIPTKLGCMREGLECRVSWSSQLCTWHRYC